MASADSSEKSTASPVAAEDVAVMPSTDRYSRGPHVPSKGREELSLAEATATPPRPAGVRGFVTCSSSVSVESFGDIETDIVGETKAGDTDGGLAQRKLQKHLLQPGVGPFPVVGDTARIHFVAHVLEKDGAEFANTFQHDKPFEFVVGRTTQVIRGLQAAVLSMRVGEFSAFRIEPEDAYGEVGAGPVPPNAALGLQVYLVSLGAAAGDVTIHRASAASVWSQVKARNKKELQQEFEESATHSKRVIRPPESSAAVPKPGDTVTIHYEAALDNDTVFDSTLLASRPLVVHLGPGSSSIVPGLEDAIFTMAEGEVAYVVVPAEYGYKAAGVEGLVPPHARLHYTVTLMKVERASQACRIM